MSTLLLSDLHLPTAPSPLREDFLHFLQGPARHARAVYLLGDIFEAWIGDADGLQTYAAEVAALRALTAAGVDVQLQHGNRDFLIGTGFERATGVRLIADPMLVDLEGRPTLLMHGDRLCTDDVAYQRWRRLSRHALVQSGFAALPVAAKQAVARWLRRRSRQSTQRKAATIMDVNDTAVREAFEQYGVDRLIHGHTHRPQVHRVGLGSRTGERIVLPDWREDRRDYLEIEGERLRWLSARG